MHEEDFPLAAMGVFVTDHITAMLAYWDKNLICRFANNAYKDWFGRTKDELINKITMRELLGPLYEKNLPYIKGVLNGEKQVFEREIPVPGETGMRHSLATYFPDLVDGEVRGFFVHVADVTYIKELEKKLHSSRKLMLKSIMEARENERARLATLLRDNISQKLISCKMMIKEETRRPTDASVYEKIISVIYTTLEDVKNMSMIIDPSEVADLGLLDGISSFIKGFQASQPYSVYFKCDNEQIEKVPDIDKLCIFRIIQNCMLLLVDSRYCRTAIILIIYTHPHVRIEFRHDADKFNTDNYASAMSEINSILEYYNGTVSIIHQRKQMHCL